MQVVKLLYFAYGRFLVKSKKRLFSSPIFHLQYGPVVEEVHQQFRGMVVLDLLINQISKLLKIII
nr:type II toxin-antitoxin system antitoxin SocA domain-containing protein [Lactobacillus helveticus]